MVRIGSESGDEQEFISWMGELLVNELRAEVAVDAFGNLVAHVPPSGESSESACMVLVAHADTVRPGIGIEPVEEGGVLRSKGNTILGADCKAGIAGIVVAVMEAKRRPPVDIVLTVQEEAGLQGSRNLDLALLHGSEAYVLDGEAIDEIIIGGPTRITFDITVRGVAAHAGMEPEKGVSAIRVAAEALLLVPEGRIDEETTANFATIRGGTALNAVPGEVFLEAECRSLDDAKAQRQASLIREAFDRICLLRGAQSEIEQTTQYRATCLPEDSQIVAKATAAVEATGLQPQKRAITGGTDALILMSRGMNAVALGTGVRDPHSLAESISTKDMKLATQVLVALLEGS